jgi:hypothetical protein
MKTESSLLGSDHRIVVGDLSHGTIGQAVQEVTGRHPSGFVCDVIDEKSVDLAVDADVVRGRRSNRNIAAPRPRKPRASSSEGGTRTRDTTIMSRVL